MTASAAASAPTSSFLLSPSSLPPSARDLLAYERLIIDGYSTRQAAEELKISQTRVRQIVRRVADWLADNLPAHNETRQAAQIRLAQHIASERLHRYTCECERAWQQTRETKYVGLLIRLLTAQSKLPAHPHTLLSLATDADDIESRVGQACEANAGPPRPTRSASEVKQASIPQTTSAASSPSAQIQNPKPQIQNSSPPRNRACSPAQPSASTSNPKNSAEKSISPPLQTPSAAAKNTPNSARQSFLTPAHPLGGTGILPVLSSAPSSDATITELQLTPQSVGLTTKNHSTRRERRRLQRLLSKK